MNKKKDDRKERPIRHGPEPERLKIEGDPGEVLDKLLNVDRDDEEETENTETESSKDRK